MNNGTVSLNALVFLAFLTVRAYSDDFVMTAGQYSGVLDPSGTGLLIEINTLVMNELGLSINLQVMPLRRAWHTFYAGKSQVQFAVFTDAKRSTTILYSAPFASINRYIMVKNGSPQITSLPELKFKRVGLVQGHPYGDLNILLKHQNSYIHYSSSQLSNLRMLNSGRINAIVANPFEIATLTKNEGSAMPTFDTQQPISINRFAYAFHNTEEGRRLQNMFTEAITKLKKQELFQAHINRLETVLNRPYKIKEHTMKKR